MDINVIQQFFLEVSPNDKVSCVLKNLMINRGIPDAQYPSELYEGSYITQLDPNDRESLIKFFTYAEENMLTPFFHPNPLIDLDS